MQGTAKMAATRLYAGRGGVVTPQFSFDSIRKNTRQKKKIVSALRSEVSGFMINKGMKGILMK
jgi:hypothetical protein